ncbi:transcriptional regulator, TetR family [Streptococcus equinus]|uniref:TetR/AcrR family transcriptional regulator n=1 Tax=Streptococcus equinus TaxID=1335 RepID=UPI0008716F69|nr:TetR/AcrR family transcriptional regulator [Streptococcus equinus]SCW48414.1 transcriptional regulator, TetR family [Streptococcus equinus]
MVRGTRENIIHAVFSLASKNPNRFNFSISEIAQEAGISRQAIYKNHFDSFEEILCYIHSHIDCEIKKKFSDYTYSKKDIITFFAYEVLPILYKYRDWLKFLYSTDIDPHWHSFLKKEYTTWIKENITLNTEKKIFSNEFRINLIVNYTLGILEVWLSEEIPIPPKIFAKKFILLSNTTISELLTSPAFNQSPSNYRKALKK